MATLCQGICNADAAEKGKEGHVMFGKGWPALKACKDSSQMNGNIVAAVSLF